MMFFRRIVFFLCGFALLQCLEASHIRHINQAVIGGGICGLTYAYRTLQKQPQDSVIVFEASDRLGGRIETNRSVSNRPVEMGAELIDPHQKPIINLVTALGLKLKAKSVLDTVRAFDRTRVFQVKEMIPFLEEASTQLKKFREENNRDYRVRFDPQILSPNTYKILQAFSRDERGRDLVDLLSGDWIAMYNIIQERLKLAKVNSRCHRFLLSAIQTVDRCVNQFGTALSFIEGGSETIIAALSSSVGEDNICLSHKLRGIQKLEGGSYQLDLQTPQGPITVIANKVIMAIPFAAWKQEPGLMNQNAKMIFGDDLIGLVNSLSYCHIRKVMLVPPAGVNPKNPLSFGLDLDREVEGWQQQFGSYTLMCGGGASSSVPFADQNEIDQTVTKLSGGEVTTAGIVEKYHSAAYSYIDDVTFNKYWRILYHENIPVERMPPVKPFVLNLAQRSLNTLFVIGEHTAALETGYMNSAVQSAEWAAAASAASASASIVGDAAQK